MKIQSISSDRKIKKITLRISLLFTFSFFLLRFPFVFADPASTNYQIADSYFPSAIGVADSANYAMDEIALDIFEKPALSSTNYAVQGQIGISGINNLPVITATDPSSFGRFFSDETADYTVSAVSTDEDTLNYQVRQDGTIKDGPQLSSELSWALSGADLGRRAHSLEVIDPDGTVVKTQSAYIFRHPVK